MSITWTTENTEVQVKSYFSKLVRSVCMQELNTSNDVGIDLLIFPIRAVLFGDQREVVSGRDKEITNVYDPRNFKR